MLLQHRFMASERGIAMLKRHCGCYKSPQGCGVDRSSAFITHASQIQKSRTLVNIFEPQSAISFASASPFVSTCTTKSVIEQSYVITIVCNHSVRMQCFGQLFVCVRVVHIAPATNFSYESLNLTLATPDSFNLWLKVLSQKLGTSLHSLPPIYYHCFLLSAVKNFSFSDCKAGAEALESCILGSEKWTLHPDSLPSNDKPRHIVSFQE